MKEKVKCKKCGLFIDEDCESCPYCGYPQNHDLKTKANETSEKNTDEKNIENFEKTPKILFKNESNSKVEDTKKVNFFDFESRVMKINPMKSLTFFIVGFLFIKVIALIFQLIGQNGGWYFIASGTYSGAINFASYFVTLGIIILILSNNSNQFFKEFANKWTWIYGLGFGFLLMIASSAVTAFMNLFQQVGENANESAIDSITTSFPVLSVIVFGLLGPICEEFTFRVGLFSFLKKYNRIAAYLGTAIVFGFLHFTFNPSTIITELINLPSYIVAGLLLCYFYDYKGIGASTVAHMTNNLFAIISQLVLSFLM